MEAATPRKKVGDKMPKTPKVKEPKTPKAAAVGGVGAAEVEKKFFAELEAGRAQMFLGCEAGGEIGGDTDSPMGDGLPTFIGPAEYGTFLYLGIVWPEVLQSFAKKGFKSSVIEIVEATHSKAGKMVVFNFRGTKYFADRLIGPPAVYTLCTMSER